LKIRIAPSRAFLARVVLPVFALAVALATGEAAAQIQSVVISKGSENVQTSAARVDPVPRPNGYGFGADVNGPLGGPSIGGIATPILTGPINTAALGTIHNNGRLVYRPGDNGWRWGLNANDAGYSSAAIRDGFFGNGTYNIAVAGTTVTLRLTGDQYPNAPLLTLSGGAWIGGKYVIDTDKPLTITTNEFTAYGTHVDDQICMGLIGGQFTLPWEEIAPFGCSNFGNIPLASRSARTSPGTKTATLTIPANTLRDGVEYVAVVGFTAVVDDQPNGALPASRNVAVYEQSTLVQVLARAPVFGLTNTVTSTPTTIGATSNLQFRPQDVGTQGSVYAFALAPESLVRPAAAPIEPTRIGKAVGAGGKDTAVACVIAQLNSNGQLQAANLSSLTAAVTGLLASAGSTVAVIPPGSSTASVGGATFFVGYGSSSNGMITSGLTRSVTTVSGTPKCEPSAPQTGWWWNPAESGRGFGVEVKGRNIFYNGFLYDTDGRATWVIAAGPTSLDGSVFAGDLLQFSGGQTLTGAYKAPGPAQKVGTVLLTFNTAQAGTMVWPGGVVPIQRQDFNNVNAAPQQGVPESGWWWNPAESGRGFFLEWQNGILDMAGFMYDDTGKPIWYLAVQATPNPATLASSWTRYANGQTLAGAYKAPTLINTNVGPVSIQFSSTTTGTMTLPGGRTIPIERQPF
jgi:hypothetical protein